MQETRIYVAGHRGMVGSALAEDNYDLAASHLLPALIRKAHEAKRRGDAELVVWGSGTPRREFLYVDGLADACVFLMERDTSPELLNIGAGEDLTIAELAETVMRMVGFEGRISTTRASPTARRASCSTLAAARRSGGERRRRCAKVLQRHTPSSAGSLNGKEDRVAA